MVLSGDQVPKYAGLHRATHLRGTKPPRLLRSPASLRLARPTEVERDSQPAHKTRSVSSAITLQGRGCGGGGPGRVFGPRAAVVGKDEGCRGDRFQPA